MRFKGKLKVKGKGKPVKEKRFNLSIQTETVLKLCFFCALIVSTPHTFELLYRLEHGEEWFRWIKAGAGAFVLDIAAGVFLHIAASFIYRLETTITSAAFGLLFGFSIFWINWLYYGPAEWGIAALVPFASVAFSVVWAMLSMGKEVKHLALTGETHEGLTVATQFNLYQNVETKVEALDPHPSEITALLEETAPKVLTAQERRVEIGKVEGDINKSELARRFGVSVTTISKDLEVIARR
jgi:hypothetical protein